MTGDQDYTDLTVKPGSIIQSDDLSGIKELYDRELLKRLENNLQFTWTDTTGMGTTVNWMKPKSYSIENKSMDNTDRSICKHWFDMFIKNHPDWHFILNPSDPFFKQGGFKVTNGKHTIAHTYPSSDLAVTPKLRSADPLGSIGLECSRFNMKSFIAWAMGIEPLPEEMK